MARANMTPLLPVPLAEYGKKVKAVIRAANWGLHTAELISVDEDDVVWRFCDDHSELSYNVDVIYWEYID